jgi:diguanylate cyclase (GGDEF)-like protein
MNDNMMHETELYLLEVFNTLLDHEVRKVRRYKQPLSLIHIAVDAEPDTPQTQQGAELVTINTLDAELRDTDIPCRNGHEFLVLLPETDQSGARNACERLEKLLHTSDQTDDGVAFQVSAFIGLASIADKLPPTSANLLDAACKAMQHARLTHSRSTVVFSELDEMDRA